MTEAIEALQIAKVGRVTTSALAIPMMYYSGYPSSLKGKDIK